MIKKLNKNEILSIFDKVEELLCKLPGYEPGSYMSIYWAGGDDFLDYYYYDDNLGYITTMIVDYGNRVTDFYGKSINNVIRNHVYDSFPHLLYRLTREENLLDEIKLYNLANMKDSSFKQNKLKWLNNILYYTRIINKYIYNDEIVNYLPLPVDSIIIAISKFNEFLFQNSIEFLDFMETSIYSITYYEYQYYKNDNGYYRKAFSYEHIEPYSKEERVCYKPLNLANIDKIEFIGRTNVDVIRFYMNEIIDENASKYAINMTKDDKWDYSKGGNPKYIRIKKETLANYHNIIDPYIEDSRFKEMIKDIL